MSKKSKNKNETPEIEISKMADKFIAIANDLVQKEGQDIGKVSTAFRYAAARFNAHEASTKTKDLAADKDNAINWYTDQYQKMLIENIEQIIKMSAILKK